MRKIFYLLTLVTLVFSSCSPLEDVYDELDAVNGEENGIEGVTSYTLIESDYTESVEDGGLGFDSEFFSSEANVEETLPAFLANKYPVWGDGSLVNVTYNVYSPNILEPVTASSTLSSLNGIDAYLSADQDYETASNGTFVELTYDAAVLSYELSDEDFVTIASALSSSYPDATESAGQYGNFERREDDSAYWSDSMILEGLYELLGGNYNLGQVVAVSFAIYDGGTNWSESFTIQYTGNGFIKLDAEVTAVAPTVEYTLSGGDYTTIATDSGLVAAYPDATDNLNSFGNFNRQGGDDNWTDEMILEGLNIILPTAAEGDIYAVTYDFYDGSGGTEVVTLLYASGAYVANTTTVEATTIVAKNDGGWEFPYVFTEADYDLLGQSYGNFDSSSVYKLDIFLESLYPYAASEDVANVIYEYYDGGTSTKYGTSVFDGDKWTIALDVIETTFQYGYEDGQWVPDNTIVYTLTQADYDLVGNGFFANFDVREGKDEETEEARLVKINTILANNFPADEEGQKYAVNYNIYNGADDVWTMKVIKSGSEYILQD